MPPKPSLPPRDGRLGSSSSHFGSSQQHNEPYYSNEEITIIHQIVTAAEEILPTLPERDRLPTNALFNAAAQVLPAHGLDPDNAPYNISRLMFRIGGMRSEGSLMDKFSSILEGMRINLEFIETEQQQNQRSSSSADRSRSSASVSGSLLVDQTGTFSVSPHYHARRRRNSESAAPTAPIEDLRDTPVLFYDRARSVSIGSEPVVDRLDRGIPNDENRPPRQPLPAKKGNALEVDSDEVGEERPTKPRPLPLRPSFVQDDETDDGFPYRRHVVDDYPESDGEHVDEYPPSDDHADHVDHAYDLSRAEDGPDYFVGSSDTMAHDSDELPAEPVLTEQDRDELEEDVQGFQVKHADRKAATNLSTWGNAARNTARRHQHQEAQAIALDRDYMLCPKIGLWRKHAEAAEMQRLASQGPPRDAAEDKKTERNVDRAYDYVVKQKAFFHWAASAQDECDRTSIARRHILRKRYFTIWRSHQADVEAKIYNFRLRTLLRIWRRTTIHHEVRENVAVQRYRHDLVKTVFSTWYDEYRAQLADDLWACRLKENCMIVWQVETRRKPVLHEDCLFYHQRFLFEGTISTWADAIEQLRIMAYGCTEQKITRDLQRNVEDWRTVAALSKKLRYFNEERDQQVKDRVIGLWLAKTNEAEQKALLAKRLVMQQFFAHWRNETKLRRFKDLRSRELKLETLSHWRREQKLANYKRLGEQRTKKGILAELCRAAAELQSEAGEGLEIADTVAERREKSSILGIWQQRTNGCLRQSRMAANRHYFSMTSSYLGRWYSNAGDEAARVTDLQAFAARGAYYVATSDALESWAKITKEARRERLTVAYHTFRRRYKVKLVTKCLAKWRRATYDSRALSYDADNIFGGHLRDELADCVQLWRDTTNVLQVIQDVAKTAEQEVWWGKWSRRAKDLRETDLAAADYCNDQTLSRCWRTWEFAMLQNKGRQHVVATLQENNDKKLCRQIVSLWSQKAAPDSAYPDLRSSVASRRSVRFGNVRAAETPRFGNFANPSSAQLPAQELPQLQEDSDHIYAATPRRQYGRQSEPVRNPFLAPPKELAQSLPQRPKGYSKHDLPPLGATPKPPISSFPASAGIPATHHTSPTTQRPSSRGGSHDTPQSHPSRPDFDEDDISFAPSEGNDYPATFMSTPTRWTGWASSQSQAQRQQPRGQPTVPAVATTTPSAVLDTPYERALRREYGGVQLAGERRLARDNMARMATPRVTFADIREESGDGIDEGVEER